MRPEYPSYRSATPPATKCPAHTLSALSTLDQVAPCPGTDDHADLGVCPHRHSFADTKGEFPADFGRSATLAEAQQYPINVA